MRKYLNLILRLRSGLILSVIEGLRANLVLGLIFAFLVNTFGPVPAFAQIDPMPFMPKPGTMVPLSPEYTPAYLKGIVIHPENALKFDFIIYKGDKPLNDAQKRQEYTKLAKYFLASLAIPDDDQWVNLSPYEKDRIIKDDFGKTEMGRDLLAQDYLLKQITASLIYPESQIGQEFWKKVYAQAQKQYGTTNIPVNTFNKVWILPDDALIYEKSTENNSGIDKQGTGNITAYVLKNHLRVMLEEDYLSLQKHSGITHTVIPASPAESGAKAGIQSNTHTIASQIIRQIILPELEREVNQDKNFAPLRQVYSGMLLATWFKRTLKQSLLGQIYVNKAKIKGVEYKNSVIPSLRSGQALSPAGAKDHKTSYDSSALRPQNDIERIYQQYLQAYKKGVFNFIKEDTDRLTNETIPRKYFSGGDVSYAMASAFTGKEVVNTTHDSAMGNRMMLRDGPMDDMAQVGLIDDAAMLNSEQNLSLNLMSIRRNLSSIRQVARRKTASSMQRMDVEESFEKVHTALIQINTQGASDLIKFLLPYWNFIKEDLNEFGEQENWEHILTLLDRMEQAIPNPQIFTDENIANINSLRNFMEEHASNLFENQTRVLIDELKIQHVASASPDEVPSNFKVLGPSGLMSAQEAKKEVEAGRALFQRALHDTKIFFFLVRIANREITREQMKDMVFKEGQLMKVTIKEKGPNGRTGSMEVRYRDHDANFLGVSLPGESNDWKNATSLSWDEHPIFATLLKVEVFDDEMPTVKEKIRVMKRPSLSLGDIENRVSRFHNGNMEKHTLEELKQGKFFQIVVNRAYNNYASFWQGGLRPKGIKLFIDGEYITTYPIEGSVYTGTIAAEFLHEVELRRQENESYIVNAHLNGVQVFTVPGNPAMNSGVDDLLLAMKDEDGRKAYDAYRQLARIDLRYALVIPVDILFRRRIAERMTYSEKKINVVTDFPGNNVFIENRRHRLLGSFERVIDELLVNAFKYTPENGTITVRARQEGENVIISVQNTGLGIPEAEIPKIWSTGYRASNAVGIEEGRGLGLFGVRQVVEHLYGGTINVESREGRETTFTINIPRGDVPDFAMGAGKEDAAMNGETDFTFDTVIDFNSQPELLDGLFDFGRLIISKWILEMLDRGLGQAELSSSLRNGIELLKSQKDKIIVRFEDWDRMISSASYLIFGKVLNESDFFNKLNEMRNDKKIRANMDNADIAFAVIVRLARVKKMRFTFRELLVLYREWLKFMKKNLSSPLGITKQGFIKLPPVPVDITSDLDAQFLKRALRVALNQVPDAATRGKEKEDMAMKANGFSNTGGIDLNSANLAMTIKRDGNGVPLPLAQQDLAQLNNIEGLDPVILSIKPASQTALFSQLVGQAIKT